MLPTIFTLLAAAAAVSAQTSTIIAAPVVSSNPVGASYKAELPAKGTVRGSVVGTSGEDGKGVRYAVSVSGLPAEGGPFMYHIHQFPVPSDGNCTGAGAHLDPYKRGEVPACDASNKETCQTGDLSGKYGNFTGLSGSASYLDLYTSTDPSDPSFFGNLSIVFHLSNKTRISCANFTLVNAGGLNVSSGVALPTGTGSPNGTYALPSPTGSSDKPSGTNAPTFTSAPPTQPSNGADRLMIAGAGVLAGAIAMVL